MFQQYSYQHDELPELKSEYMKKLATELHDELKYYQDARQELTEIIWPACDRAYMCIGKLPKAEGMDWVDKSDLRETDIKDAVDFLSASSTLALMPRDQSWQEPITRKTDQQATMNKVRDYLQYVHRTADTRGNFEMNLKQLFVRGTSAIHWSWKRKTRMKRMGAAASLRQMADIAQEVEVPITLQDLKQGREEKVVFDGPIVKTIDMQDLWVDPAADLSAEDEMPTIWRQFISMEDLKGAVEVDGKTPMFGNLDGIEPMRIDEIYSRDPWRHESTRNLGIDPVSKQSKSQLYVPVYVFHRMVRRFETKQFVDCYFYMAETNNNDAAYKIIRAVENPSDFGHRSVFLGTYQDWLNAAYGIGAVEKSISAWQQKNVLSALTLQAQLATVFPAYIVIAGMLLDDRRLRLGPGLMNHIQYRPSIGTRFIEAVPVPKDGQQLGEMAQRWQGEKIMTQMGAYGAQLNDPTRAVEQAKTATQINTESTTGAVTRDNFLERVVIRQLEPLCQAMLDAAKQFGGDQLEYELASEGEGRYGFGELTKEELEVADRVVVTGYHGQINKAAEIRELNEALAVMTPALNLPGMFAKTIGPFQETLFKLLGRLGVANLDKYRGDPLELILKDPMIMQRISQALEMAKQQGAEQAAAGGGPFSGLMPPPEGGPPPGPPLMGPPGQGSNVSSALIAGGAPNVG